MTRRDEVIRMALEAGLLRDARGLYPPACVEDMTALFERFAALVTAAERERCAKVLDGILTPSEDASALLRFAAHTIRSLKP